MILTDRLFLKLFKIGFMRLFLCFLLISFAAQAQQTNKQDKFSTQVTSIRADSLSALQKPNNLPANMKQSVSDFEHDNKQNTLKDNKKENLPGFSTDVQNNAANAR